MIIRLETLSAANRWMLCPASSVLPHAPAREITEGPAVLGTDVHAYLLGDIPRLGAIAAMARAPERSKAFCARVELDGLPLAPEFLHEIALAMDIETGRVVELGRNVGRNYEALLSSRSEDLNRLWLCGTLDIGGVYADHVYCGDIKTGHGGEAYAPAAERNYQVKLGALLLALLHRKPSARVEVIHITDEGWHWKTEARLDELDLDILLADLRSAVAAAQRAAVLVSEGMDPPVTVGVYCRHCPAAGDCPKRHDVVLQVARGPDALAASTRASVTSGDVRTAYFAWQTMKRITDDLGEAITAYALEHGLDLGNGTEWSARETAPRKILDPGITWEVVKAAHGEAAARAAVSMEATQTGLQRALELVGVGNRAAGKRDLLAQIEARGGVTEKPGSRRLEIRAKERAA